MALREVSFERLDRWCSCVKDNPLPKCETNKSKPNCANRHWLARLILQALEEGISRRFRCFTFDALLEAR